MTDIGDLTRYVEAQPEDHEQRWHLAKKLYMAGEYRPALGHLLVLQTNWTPKVNVLRYLAASVWVPAYFAAGESMRQRAAFTLLAWAEIIRLNPTHAMARHALAKLQEEEAAKDAPKQASSLQDVDFGIMPGHACPNCGAQNSDEFDRCWKCHAPLDDAGAVGTPVLAAPKEAYGRRLAVGPRSAPAHDGRARVGVRVWYVLSVLATVALIAGGAYLSVMQSVMLRTAGTAPFLYATVQALLDASLLSTRITIGLVLLIAWPIMLWMAAAVLKPRAPRATAGAPFRAVLAAGLLLAAATYLVSWNQPGQWAYLFLLIQVLALIPIAVTFNLGVVRALAVCLIQAALMSCVVFVSAVTLEGSSFVKEFTIIANYQAHHDNALRTGVDPGTHLLPPMVVPVDATVRWESTGSPWLDERATGMTCEVASNAPATGPIPASGLIVELKDQTGTLAYNHVPSMPFTFTYDRIVPNQAYKLLITGPENNR